jgi:hypothetical protein
MPLRSDEIRELASSLNVEWNFARLKLVASDWFSLTLEDLAPLNSEKIEYATAFVSKVNELGRDHEFLLRLQGEGNANIQRIAIKLLTVPFISTQDENAYFAISLESTPFIGRNELRRNIENFSNPQVRRKKSRVLIVSGSKPCGKSITKEYLRHLAEEVAGAQFAVPLDMSQLKPTVKEFFKAIGSKLRLDFDNPPFPDLEDEPQEAREIIPYIFWLEGALSKKNGAYWLTIDELNHAQVTKIAREAAYEVARWAQEYRGNLWVALLGYNEPVTDHDLRRGAVLDIAEFPPKSAIVEYFMTLAKKGGMVDLQQDEVETWTDKVLNKYPKLDKETMMNLTDKLEDIGEDLLDGQQPVLED